jgi:hypothetical protein
MTGTADEWREFWRERGAPANERVDAEAAAAITDWFPRA